MSAARKFLFDTSFDELEPSPLAAGEAPDALAPTRAEIDAARAEGLEQGRAAAIAEISAHIETRAAEALLSLDGHVAALLAARAEITQETESQALALVRTVLQKSVPALCRKDPAAEIEALVARCLAETLDEPRLVLRVSDLLFDAMQARLEAMSQANGYAGKFVLLADAALANGDAKVEWADGGAERDTGRLIAEIDEILSRNVAATPLPPKEKADE
jgi:flagellar assembly protein FliH